MLKNLWISIPLSLLCVVAQAQAPAAPAAPATPAAPAAAASTMAAPAAPAASSLSYTFDYEANYALQAEKQADGTRSQSITHDFKPGFKYGDYSGSILFEVEQDLVNTDTNTWTDPAIVFKKKAWTLGDYFKLAPQAAITLPMKDSSRNEVGLLYNIGGALALSLNTKTLGMEAFSLAWAVYVNRNFTQFDTNAKTGAPNSEGRIRNRLTVGYNITDKLQFFNLFDFNSNYSVNGVVTNSFFLLNSLGYDITDNVNISIAHTNGGSYLKAGTYENNLKAYDSENSAYNLDIAISL